MKLLALFVASAAAVQTANLTFHSTSEYYRLLVPADGSPMQANNLITVDYIDAPDYLASQFCTFSTPAPFNMSTRIGADGRTRQLVLHPPSVIESVACEGKCVGTYGTYTICDGPTDIQATATTRSKASTSDRAAMASVPRINAVPGTTDSN